MLRRATDHRQPEAHPNFMQRIGDIVAKLNPFLLPAAKLLERIHHCASGFATAIRHEINILLGRRLGFIVALKLGLILLR